MSERRPDPVWGDSPARVGGIKHEPRHRFDCTRCKFHWCCGVLCPCDLRLPDPPKDVMDRVRAARAGWRIGRGAKTSAEIFDPTENP